MTDFLHHKLEMQLDNHFSLKVLQVRSLFFYSRTIIKRDGNLLVYSNVYTMFTLRSSNLFGSGGGGEVAGSKVMFLFMFVFTGVYPSMHLGRGVDRVQVQAEGIHPPVHTPIFGILLECILV